MKLSDFDYTLPTELIAQEPLIKRSASRLMVLDRLSGAVEHRHFEDITGVLMPGDCLVINDTRVIPARLIGRREPTGGRVEILLLKRVSADSWECLVRPGKRLKSGACISIGDGLLMATVLDILDDGRRLVGFRYEGVFEEILDKLGEMPLPPYITHRLEDRDRYQTVYAEHTGSAAAPTAGFHFTGELLREIEAMGVRIVRLTLHVGLGTFRPVKCDDIEDHHMHSEWYELSAEAADAVNDTLREGHRVFAVGTTSVRTLETSAVPDPEYERLVAEGASPVVMHGIRAVRADDGTFVTEYRLRAGSGETDIFIYPGYHWKVTECLITNFHLPRSTLLMLVASFAGREAVLNAYEEAVRERYRFFSFGDAMLIL